MSDRRAVLLAGIPTIAVAYGLARYAYGLFVPELAAALELGDAAVGLAGGAGHLGYAVGLVSAPRWVRWRGSAAASVDAGVLAPVALLSAAGFGAAFMALTGLIIVWATGVHDDAAAGVRACFLALGLGQAVGTPLAGAGMDLLGASATFLLSAAGGLALLALTPPRARRPSSASRP